MTNLSPKDIEYTLSWANHSAVVSPFGATLRRYFVTTPSGEWNAIWGYGGGDNKKGGQGDVLIPFPGRIKNGTYPFEGKTHQLVKNDKDGPNAIHGFLRTENFETKKLSDSEAIFSFEITKEKYAERGFPFSLSIEVSYAINEAGLKTSYRIKNTGDTNAPVGVGFHPYFCAEKGSLADWTVTIPAKEFIEIENYVPTGNVRAVTGTKLDFQNGRTIGSERYNDCVTKLHRDKNGMAHAIVQAGNSKNRVVISMDQSFDYVVIYTGDNIPAPHARLGFAIEPMTCAPDAFNYDGWGTRVLSPAAEMSGSYTILAETC